MKQTSYLFFLFIILPAFSFSQEICNNNIDDDGDRLIDLYDIEDCPCSRTDTFKISLIPNPSFENVNCIPNGYSQLSCAEGWDQATLATSDLYSINGFIPDEVALPIPHGNNCVGTIIDAEWMEYIGTCLTGPLLAGQSYLLKFNVASDIFSGTPNFPEYPVDLILFGKTTCDSFPLQTTSCPESLGWKEIGKVRYLTTHSWITMEMSFSPNEDIYSVMLGGPCDFPPILSYFIFWDNLQLNRSEDEIIYYVPNTFTPNGDEHNNKFNPVFVCGYDPLEYKFEVYNRWGELVFSSMDSQTGWDGTYNGMPAQEGVFGWKLEYKAEETPEKKVLTGHANLLR